MKHIAFFTTILTIITIVSLKPNVNGAADRREYILKTATRQKGFI